MSDKTVYTIQRNDGQEVRITLREYKGNQYVDIRMFFQPKEGGDMIPTKKGITMPVAYLGELRKALKEAQDMLPSEEIVP